MSRTVDLRVFMRRRLKVNKRLTTCLLVAGDILTEHLTAPGCRTILTRWYAS